MLAVLVTHSTHSCVLCQFLDQKLKSGGQVNTLNRWIKVACARNQEEKTPECGAAPRRQEKSLGKSGGDER